MPRRLAAGNWKMNGTRGNLSELDALMARHPAPSVDLLLFPPATLVAQAADRVAGHPMLIGAQDCHPAPSGAHTGDLSAAILADAGAGAVILGHSERRENHHETNALVCDKVMAVQAAGLIALACIGETLEQREGGQTLQVIAEQIAQSLPDGATPENTVIAYEPVWAIGTGLTPETGQIAEVHDFLRQALSDRFGSGNGNGFRLLYGGSVKPANAAEIFGVDNVDGALVGGASLRADDFSPVIDALENA